MYWSPNIEKTKQEETIETIILLVSSLFSFFGGLSTALNGFSLFSKLLPGISRQQTIFLSDLRFFVQWFDCSMVQSICDCSSVQSAVCLSKWLAAAPVFLLGATRHFVWLSRKVCATISVWTISLGRHSRLWRLCTILALDFLISWIITSSLLIAFLAFSRAVTSTVWFAFKFDENLSWVHPNVFENLTVCVSSSWQLFLMASIRQIEPSHDVSPF